MTDNLNQLRRLGQSADKHILAFLGKQLSKRYRGAAKFDMTKHVIGKDWQDSDMDVFSPIKVSFSTRFFETRDLPDVVKQLGFSETVLDMRIQIILNFCFVYYRGYKFVEVDQLYQKGTTSNKFWLKRDLVFPELSIMMIQNHINHLPKGHELEIKVNRLICHEKDV